MCSLCFPCSIEDVKYLRPAFLAIPPLAPRAAFVVVIVIVVPGPLTYRKRPAHAANVRAAALAHARPHAPAGLRVFSSTTTRNRFTGALVKSFMIFVQRRAGSSWSVLT